MVIYKKNNTAEIMTNNVFFNLFQTFKQNTYTMNKRPVCSYWVPFHF